MGRQKSQVQYCTIAHIHLMRRLPLSYVCSVKASGKASAAGCLTGEHSESGDHSAHMYSHGCYAILFQLKAGFCNDDVAQHNVQYWADTDLKHQCCLVLTPCHWSSLAFRLAVLMRILTFCRAQSTHTSTQSISCLHRPTTIHGHLAVYCVTSAACSNAAPVMHHGRCMCQIFMHEAIAKLEGNLHTISDSPEGGLLNVIMSRLYSIP